VRVRSVRGVDVAVLEDGLQNRLLPRGLAVDGVLPSEERYASPLGTALLLREADELN
jgi:hypothetical protein